MAVCSNCGRESTRIRTTVHESRPGVFSHLTDECPGCAPGSFEPRWRTERGAMGWEAYPTMYRKITAPDGSVGYEAKDELRADTEARIARPCQEDEQAKEIALAERRRMCASAPRRLTATQIEAAKAYWTPKLKEREARRATENVGDQN